MPKLIKNGRVVADDFAIFTLAEGEDAASVALPAERVLVPLAVWLARRDELAGRVAAGEVGVWLASEDGPEAIGEEAARFAVIAIDFPKFTVGRGYSTGALLRTRYRYKGELRAIGEVLRDQFNYLTRCGFDALQPRAERYSDDELEAAVASIGDFTQPYQSSVLHPLPLFRRANRAAAQGEVKP